MEEKRNENEHLTATAMIRFFNRRWNTVVDLFVGLFGLTPETARTTILVASVPLLTATVRFLYWLYLFVHYHLGYNVPAAYLTVDISWLVSFGAGVLAIMAFIGFSAYVLCIVSNTHYPVIPLLGPVVVVEILFGLLFFGGSNGLEICKLFAQGVIICCLLNHSIWFYAFFEDIKYCELNEANNKQYERDEYTKVFYHVTMILDGIIFILICAWWLQPFLVRSGLQLGISFYTWFVCFVYIFMLFGNLVFITCKPQRREAIFQLCLMIVLTIFCFLTVDNYFDRKSPYAITTNEQQVVVYQSKDVSVLEPATIEADEETGNITLTIDTAKQQIVDSTSLSYEYQSFETVEIIKTKSDSQDSADDSSISDNAESSAVADIDIDPADTSTDPADGAASYDTSN